MARPLRLSSPRSRVNSCATAGTAPMATKTTQSPRTSATPVAWDLGRVIGTPCQFDDAHGEATGLIAVEFDEFTRGDHAFTDEKLHLVVDTAVERQDSVRLHREHVPEFRARMADTHANLDRQPLQGGGSGRGDRVGAIGHHATPLAA